MRDKPLLKAEMGRRQVPGFEPAKWATCGVFEIPRNGVILAVIACDGRVHEIGWDHVSVSVAHRCPTWEEMCFIKKQFFFRDECVLQFHPDESSYVNHHPYCLHLWRPINSPILMPPVKCV